LAQSVIGAATDRVGRRLFGKMKDHCSLPFPKSIGAPDDAAGQHSPLGIVHREIEVAAVATTGVVEFEPDPANGPVHLGGQSAVGAGRSCGPSGG
jgi:hypothetical protein